MKKKEAIKVLKELMNEFKNSKNNYNYPIETEIKALKKAIKIMEK